MKGMTREIIAQAERKMLAIAEADFADMAIPERNELLDEYKRAEQTIEAYAEARKGWMR